MNSTFAPTTLTGNFTDPNLPAGFSPYNILSGNFLQRLATNNLDSP